MSKRKPYADSLEYFEDKKKWLQLRIDRLRLRRIKDKTWTRSRNRFDDDEPSLSPHEAKKELSRIDRELEALSKEQAARIALTLDSQIDLPLESIATEFNLDVFEKWIVVLALTPTLDPNFGDAICEIGSGGRIPEIRDILEILCDTMTEKIHARNYFTSQSRLIENGIVELSRHRRMSDSDFFRMDVELPRRMAARILGEHYIDDQLVAFSSVTEPEVSLDQVILPENMLNEIVGLVKDRDRFLETRAEWGFDRILPYGKATVLLFSGPSGTGKTLLAHALAKEAGYKLLHVDLPKLLARHEFEEDLHLAFMEARLRHAFLFFDECDELFDRHSSWMPMLLREFEKLDGLAILATNKPFVIEEAMRRRILRQFEFELPNPELRQKIWKNLIPSEAAIAPDIDFAVLAEQFEISGGYIKNAVLNALHCALQRQGQERQITQEDLMAGARSQLQSSMSSHMDKVIPKAGLEHVVLAPETMESIKKLISAARNRRKVFREWGLADKVNSGKALTALFTGDSGVGKSVTAEAIAYELGQPLYPVNISSVLSRYVGDTEKRLAAILQSARNSDSIIFFDEADCFFNTRLTAGDANSRHLNQQVNTLLTEIEKHDGVVILATNLPESIDPAFQRRIRYHIPFNQPGLEQREEIWRVHLPEKAPIADDVDPKALAKKYPYSGGVIRNIILRASFAAVTGGGIITARHIEEAAGEERPLVEKRQMGFLSGQNRLAQ